MPRLLPTLSALFLAALPVAAPAVDLALVVANTDYANRSDLPGLSRDIAALVEAYDDDGYVVIEHQNVAGNSLEGALKALERRLDNADRLVIHFTGHVEVSDRNIWLLPTNIGDGGLVETAYLAPSINLIYDLLARRPGRSALMLGVPQDDIELALARAPAIPPGVLVMAGAPRTFNRVVRNDFLRDGAPAAALTSRTGVVLAGYVSDVPMERSDDTFVTPSTGAPSPNDTLVEMRAWRDAAQNGGEAALQGYLNRYPDGLFAGEARARLAALTPPEEAIEAALNLTREQRRKVQRDLTLLGFDTRGVDGIFGPGTRRAITSWQRQERFKATGFLDGAQIRVMANAAAARQRQIEEEEAAERAARDRADLDYWQATGASGRARDLRAYLEKYPEGLFAPQAKRALAELAPDTGGDDAALLARENALNMNSSTRLLVEQRLEALDLNPGRVDGKFNRRTRAAIAAFQTSRGRPATGYLDSDTISLLIVSVFSR